MAAVIKRSMQLVVELGQLPEHFQAQPDIGIEGCFGDLAVQALEHKLLEIVGFLAQFAADLVVGNAHTQLVLQLFERLRDQLVQTVQGGLAFDQQVAFP